MRIASGRAKERSLSASKRCRTGESRESRTHRVGDDGNRCDQKMKCEQCVTALPGVGKSHLVQAIGLEALKAGFLVLYRSIC